MILQYDPQVDRNYQSLMLVTLVPIVHTGKTDLGWMEDSVWQQMYQLLLNGGVLTQPINIEETYTMQFLNKIYDKAE